MKILAVDDEVNMRNFLHDMLTSFGYECKTAANGREALNILQYDYFPIILSDIRMPVMDGIEFIKDTKKHNLREEDIKYLHTIELYKKKGNDYRIKFHTKERQNGYRKFELKLGQNTEPIEFDLKDIMQDSNIITENLKEVIKFIETEVLGQH